MKKLKDILYDYNDILIALAIMVIAALLIMWRISAIVDYPREFISDNTEVSEPAGENGERYDVVDFYAFYELDGVLRQIGEKSFFDRKDDKLYYVDGVPLRGETYHRPEPKVGRNDPCPCGSGKKYKKCCGASA